MAALRWSMDVKVGEAVSSGSALLGRPRVVTGVSLVRGPPRGHSVVVEAYVKTASGSMELASNLSSERPRAELPLPVMVMTSDLFCSRVRRQGGDSAGDEVLVVRFEGRFSSSLPPPPPLVEVSEDEDDDDEDDNGEDDEEDDEEEVLEEEEEEVFGRRRRREHPLWFSDDDDDGDSETDDDDSGSEDDESDDEVEWQAPMASSAGDNVMLQPETLYRRKFVPEGQLDGGPAPRFASAGRTIGFMRVEAAKKQEEADARQIVVLYRYTRFRASSDGVQRRGRTTEHQLRFIATGDHTARSLAWAGSCLALLIYRPHSGKQLQKLWSRLASQVSVLPGARRIEVFVDVGILRRADYAAASMRHMCDALLGKVAEPWPKRFTGMELHLPEPVRCGTEGEADDDERPAKRRRVDAAEEDCPVCLQLLEGDDLAAWPGCSKPHVFHGACLEGVLEKNDACPMCRHKLYIEPKLNSCW